MFLELTFDEFRVEESSLSPDDCDHDYLEISDEIRADGSSQNSPIRFCGTFTGIKLIDINNLKKIVFHTDNTNNDIGYSIHVRQVPCEFPNPSTPSVRSTTDFPIYSPSSRIPDIPHYSKMTHYPTTEHFPIYSSSTYHPDLPSYTPSSNRPIFPTPEYEDVPEFPDYGGSGDFDGFLVADLRDVTEKERNKFHGKSENFIPAAVLTSHVSSEIPENLINEKSGIVDFDSGNSFDDESVEDSKSYEVSNSTESKDSVAFIADVNVAFKGVKNNLKIDSFDSKESLDPEIMSTESAPNLLNTEENILSNIETTEKLEDAATTIKSPEEVEDHIGVGDFSISVVEYNYLDNSDYDDNSEYFEVADKNFEELESSPHKSNSSELIISLETLDEGLLNTKINSSISNSHGKESCSKDILLHKSTRIKSPNYPMTYPNDIQCQYKILYDQEEVCGIQITYDYFSVICLSGDYLVIQDQKICGIEKGTKLYPANKEGLTLIQFVSDNVTTGNGFDIEIDKILCEDQTVSKEKNLQPAFNEYFPPENSLISGEKLAQSIPQLQSNIANPDLLQSENINDIQELLGEDQSEIDNNKQAQVSDEKKEEEFLGLTIASSNPLIPSAKVHPLASNSQDVEGQILPLRNPTAPAVLSNQLLDHTGTNLIKDGVESSQLVDSYGRPLGQRLPIQPERNPVVNHQLWLHNNNLTPHEGQRSPNSRPFDNYISPLGTVTPTISNQLYYTQPHPNPLLPITPHNQHNIPHQNQRPPHNGHLATYGSSLHRPISPNSKYVHPNPTPRPPAIPNNLHFHQHHQEPRPPHPTPSQGYGAPLGRPISPASQDIHFHPTPRLPSTPINQHVSHHHQEPRPPHPGPSGGYGAPLARPVSPTLQYIHPHPSPRPPAVPNNHHQNPIPSLKRPNLHPNPAPRPPAIPNHQHFPHQHHDSAPPYQSPSHGYVAPLGRPISHNSQYIHPNPMPRPPVIPNIQHFPQQNQEPRPPHPGPPHPKPTYKQNNQHKRKPSYNNHTKFRTPRFLDTWNQIFNIKAQVARDVINAKAQVVNNFVNFLRSPFPNTKDQNKPSYHQHRPLYLPPSQGYGAPRPPLSRSFEDEINAIETQKLGHNVSSLSSRNLIESFEDPCYLFNGNGKGYLFLQSPNYPEDYNNSFNCSVNIKATKEICHIKLKLFDFILEESMFCNEDFLLVENSEVTEPQRMCGQHSGEEIILKNSGHGLKIQFKTDSSGTTRGFHIGTNFIYC